MNWRAYIEVEPNRCQGQACIAGTRILVTAVLDSLAARIDPDEILRSYPGLTREAIDACIAYAADDPSDEQTARIWTAEAERRFAEYKAGRIAAIDAEEVFARLAARKKT